MEGADPLLCLKHRQVSISLIAEQIPVRTGFKMIMVASGVSVNGSVKMSRPYLTTMKASRLWFAKVSAMEENAAESMVKRKVAADTIVK